MASVGSSGGDRTRPLSPHIGIYSRSINMMMSIIHRMTGAALYFGTLLLAYWLVSAASGPEAFDYASSLFGSLIGRLILLGYTWALLHHMFGGIRHLIWDTGRGLSISSANFLCWLSVIASLVLTVLIWIVAGGFEGVI